MTSPDPTIATVHRSLVHYLHAAAEQAGAEERSEVARKAWWLVLERGELWEVDDGDGLRIGLSISLRKPDRERLGIEELTYVRSGDRFRGPIVDLINEVARELSGDFSWRGVTFKTPLIAATEGWQESERRAFSGDGINNQCRATTEKFLPRWTHKGFSFRSKGEVAVFDELQRRDGVVVFPLPSGCLGSSTVFEPDLLVCYRGVWGVLEVDGPHHTGRAAEDRTRDRELELRGFTASERFTYEECTDDPKRVVDSFLRLLSHRSGVAWTPQSGSTAGKVR